MHKASTTPADPVTGVLDVMRVAAEAAGLPLADYLARGEVLVHGTTHAINAIVTGRTARTALLTTMGHPDTLVFREGGRQDAFNFTVPYPDPFVPKALTFEIDERVTASGAVHRPLDADQAAAVLDRAEGDRRRGDRGLPALVDRQSRARDRPRAPDRAAPAGRALHAFPPDQPVDPRVPARHVDGARRLAQADHVAPTWPASSGGSARPASAAGCSSSPRRAA